MSVRASNINEQIYGKKKQDCESVVHHIHRNTVNEAWPNDKRICNNPLNTMICCPKQEVKHPVKCRQSMQLKHPRRYCQIEGCDRIVKSQRLCQRHGAKAKKCKVGNCDKQAQGNYDGMCKSHYKSMYPNIEPEPFIAAINNDYEMIVFHQCPSTDFAIEEDYSTFNSYLQHQQYYGAGNSISSVYPPYGGYHMPSTSYSSSPYFYDIESSIFYHSQHINWDHQKYPSGSSWNNLNGVTPVLKTTEYNVINQSSYRPNGAYFTDIATDETPLRQSLLRSSDDDQHWRFTKNADCRNICTSGRATACTTRIVYPTDSSERADCSSSSALTVKGLH